MTIAVVAGALANKPHNGGEAWVRLSWVLGLRRLGVDAWFVEEIGPAACGGSVALEQSENAAWFERVVSAFGFGDRAALIDPDGRVVRGVASDVVEEVAASADLLVNVSGNLRHRRLLSLPRRRVYVDVDPVYTQSWHASGALGATLDAHEHFLTVGLSLGGSACGVPEDGLRWRPVPPPVVLEEWPAGEPAERGRFTTVASWRGGYGRLELDGRLLTQKAHEFRSLATLPGRAAGSFEVALAIDPADAGDAERLTAEGWRLVDPRRVAGSPEDFRSYVRGSYAELSPAQGAYVETRCGWLSDRTTRYLASGRPAVVQDTGLPPELPVGEGLLTFSTLEDAVKAVDEVLGDYDRHARAARRLAEERFDSDRVLGGVLEEVLG